MTICHETPVQLRSNMSLRRDPNVLRIDTRIIPNESRRGPIDRSEATAAVGEVLRKYNITGATIAGGHGALAKQAEIGPALAAR